MAYFTIMTGLRGCYMPDNAYTIKCDTRRELKSAIAWEANSYRDAGFVGGNKRAIAWLAAKAWASRKAPSVYPYVMPLRQGNQPGNWAHSIECVLATRQDYLDQEQM